MDYSQIQNLLEQEADSLLNYKSSTFDYQLFQAPGPHFVDQVYLDSDRSNPVIRNLSNLFNHGRLGGSGYLSIFPVDQGVEHSAGARFATNPMYFDPENIIKLGLEAGCNAVTSTLGVLGLVSRRYAHKIPFIVKLNHNEFLTYPNEFNQTMFASVQQAFDMGACGVGATIYFGSSESKRQIIEVAEAFEEAHRLGMFTILWTYLRNDNFKKDRKDYHTAADLTGQANHLGVTIQADIIKQKLPNTNGGYKVLNTKENPYGKIDDKVYTQLTTDNPIDLTRYQVANCYMGKIPLINSGGDSGGNQEKDICSAVKTAVINKRAGGAGVIMGRKAFQKTFEEGIEIIQAVQDVYLCKEITLA